jgi:hypothetical protein
MPATYATLAALQLIVVVGTGVLWAVIVLVPKSQLRRYSQMIRAAHFGALFLAPLFLGLGWAFERFHVPAWHQGVLPAGLGVALALAAIGAFFPRPPELDPFHYWVRGWPLVLMVVGTIVFIVSLLWTAFVLMLYAWSSGAGPL